MYNIVGFPTPNHHGPPPIQHTKSAIFRLPRSEPAYNFLGFKKKSSLTKSVCVLTS